MKSAIHQALYDKLMEGVSVETKSDELGFRLFSESTHEDIDKIEPLILSMLAARDEELRTKMICGHPIVVMELAPLEDQPADAVMPTEQRTLVVVNAKKLVYHCSACERERRFVRALVEHIRLVPKWRTGESAQETINQVLAEGRAQA